jgi:Tol biopolymer transport system component
VAAANGSNARRITQTDGAGVPRWSPDSRELVYHARQGGSLDIYIAEATGSGTPRQLTRQPSNAWSPSWSRDGKHIYYGSKQSGKWELWRQAVSGEPAEQLTTRGGYNGRESADGKSVYYSKGNSMPGVFRLPGEDMVVPALAPAMWGNWTLSSRGIYYLDWSDSQRDSARIQFYDFQGDTTRSLATISRTPAIGDAGLAVSPDEKWLLYSQVDQAGSDVMLVEGFR